MSHSSKTSLTARPCDQYDVVVSTELWGGVDYVDCTAAGSVTVYDEGHPVHLCPAHAAQQTG